MNTSKTAIDQLQTALASTREAADTIQNLIAPHDYQDVGELAARAAAALLEAAAKLMEKEDAMALAAVEDAEELLDTFYNIIEGDLDD